ncbi:hypothetical protein DY000_02052840 [Brassica cretica]|uniref:Retrotransposon gag domain-containing protein n=1 Tax=Brassica cretica TaxID=69181 RepID=A0ABQ7AM03_BRACR|nr:hypothetical protein DY000_02052840 [Brassica cretica]
MFSKRLDAMQSMVERLPGVAPPIRKSIPDSYANTPFTDDVTLIEMPRKFSFLSIKAYDGTSDADDHVAQYRQRMLAVSLPKESREATMCKGFGSTLTGPALQCRDLEKTFNGLYEILQHRAEPLRDYIARFNQEKVAIPECSIPTAISAFKRAKARPKAVRPDRTERDEKPSLRSARDSINRNQGSYQNWPIEKAEGMAVSTWPDISHLSVSRPELINVLRQMGQQVKWPQKMKAPDSFQNPGLWCEFHRDHCHKTEDCIALKIKSKPPAHHTEEPEVEEIDDVPLIDGDQTRHHKGAVPGTGPGVLRSGEPGCLLAGTQSLPLIARFCHRTWGITCALKSTGVAHSQQASLRQDIAPMEKLWACDGILENAELGDLMFPEEELKGLMRGSRLGDWRESLLEIPDRILGLLRSSFLASGITHTDSRLTLGILFP